MEEAQFQVHKYTRCASSATLGRQELGCMSTPFFKRLWRPGLVLLIVVGSLVFLLTRQPFAQDTRYHDFADRRVFLGVPNVADVASNLPFLFVGVAGLGLCLRNRIAGAAAGWTVFFGGVALVSVGSAYYHWRPCNDTLVWDRLPMTIAFMAIFVALLSESINERLGWLLLAPAVLAGVFSVIYWHLFDDLRFYAWVQFMPLLTIPVAMTLFRNRYSHQRLLLLALGCYVLAKVFEAYDQQIFSLSNRIVGGHLVKHLLAAIACFVILEMLRRRRGVRILTTPPNKALLASAASPLS
jgi:hypothetical protein